MKRILLATAAGLFLPSLACAADARMSYITPAGVKQALGMVSAVCGTDSNDDPTQCVSGVAATKQYTTIGGSTGYLGYVVPVCSVEDGVPQVCNFSSPDLSAYLTTAAAATTYATVAALNTQVNNAAATYETISGMSKYALATNGTLTTPSITKPSIDNGTLTTDGEGNWVLSGNNGIQFGGAEWLNYNAADGYIAVNGDLEITGRVNLPTRTTGDNGNYAASTAFVQNTVDALQGSVTGDLSASGSSLTMPIGTSGLNFVMSYSASGTGSLTAVSASGTLTPVDIYEVAAWNTTSFKGYTLDSGTITTTATTVDSTFYLTSNAWGTYHVGVGGNLYIVDIFGSGAGKRTFMSWRKVY